MRAGQYHNASERAQLEERCCAHAFEFPRAVWQLTPYLLFPRSYVQACLATMARALCPARSVRGKRHNYSFVGAIGRRCVANGSITDLPLRVWARSFAAARFAQHDVFQDTYPAQPGSSVGPFDYSSERAGQGLVPFAFRFNEREKPRTSGACAGPVDTDSDYLTRIAASNFTLAPGGDSPWSVRFFEAAFLGALPIVRFASEIGRTPEERDTPWHYFLASSPHVWRKADVLHNVRLALIHHTAMNLPRHAPLSELLTQAMVGADHPVDEHLLDCVSEQHGDRGERRRTA